MEFELIWRFYRHTHTRLLYTLNIQNNVQENGEGRDGEKIGRRSRDTRTVAWRKFLVIASEILSRNARSREHYFQSDLVYAGLESGKVLAPLSCFAGCG
ncbi:hypothetical protein RRG08_038887 [Elysia crispata]|uniref:Uncharacterized protein n=1 Tax=Elysia crispata TaxID=231223 RepID=A0AAE0Y766_9GAST|nr:hypothetical protein RRG08_038887 [Elysia crispata]